MLRLARAVIGAGAGGRRSAASMAGCTLWVDPADLPREDAAAASRRAELDAARAAVLGADVAALLSDPCGVYTVVEAGSGPEVALGLRPEQLPPGLQGPTSRAKDRGGSATLAVPVRGMTPTLSGLRKLAHGEPAFKAGASWIHSAAAGGVDTVTGLPSTVVPPAERHARDPEDVSARCVWVGVVVGWGAVPPLLEPPPDALSSPSMCAEPRTLPYPPHRPCTASSTSRSGWRTRAPAGGMLRRTWKPRASCRGRACLGPAAAALPLAAAAAAPRPPPRRCWAR